jgi:hypothetical protein
MLRVLASFIAFSILLLSACSTTKQTPAAYFSVPIDKDAVQQSDTLSWWTYRFRIAWPETNEKPDFAVDLLLAHALVRPVLVEYSENLLWWRFHRRASKAAPGHQFSFLFYSDRETAVKLIQKLEDSPLLAALKDNGMVLKTLSSDTGNVGKTAIESYSDPSWSAVIQRTWPSYIMGVSAFWLALIDELKAEMSNQRQESISDTTEIDKLLDEYRTIDDEIAVMWQAEGQHVLLHHMSALFGYKPMLFKKNVIY